MGVSRSAGGQVIFVIATLVVKTDRRDAFVRDAHAVIEATRLEAGCLAYDLAGSVTAPETFVFVERWTSREALEAHFQTPHLMHWRALCADYISSAKIEIIRPDHVDVI